MDDNYTHFPDPHGARRKEGKRKIETLRTAYHRVKTPSFNPGDSVIIIEDEEKLLKLQKNHGEWNPASRIYLGQEGIIRKVNPNKDVQVEVGDTILTLNPLSLQSLTDTVDDESQESTDKIPRVDEKSRIIPVKFRSVYDQTKNSKGLALFLLFDASKQILREANELFQQIQSDLKTFSFDSKSILTKSNADDPKIAFLTKFEKTIRSIDPGTYSCLLVFIIGKRALIHYPNDNLCYNLKGQNNSIGVISHEEINKQIFTWLSFMNYAVPAIVLYSWISPTPPLDMNICSDTFLCYASNNSMSLPQGVHPHQLVLSLYEILKQSPDEPMLLTEFFTETRDHYLDLFPPIAKSGYFLDTTLYSKNTLRYPLLIKVQRINSNSESLNSVRVLPGLFFVVRSTKLLEGR